MRFPLSRICGEDAEENLDCGEMIEEGFPHIINSKIPDIYQLRLIDGHYKYLAYEKGKLPSW